MRWVVLLWLSLTLCAGAELGSLLEWQRKADPGAYVSSGFDEWRTVSKYRRRAGLHNGYDIAMLAGSPVRAAWPGRVVAIIPWFGTEYGVTVRSPGGFETTYGHISPGVILGQEVEPGDVLGRVVVDHVDVKMKGPEGRFIDFARVPPPTPPRVPEPELPPPPPDPPSALSQALERLAENPLSQDSRPTTDSLIFGSPAR